MENSIAQRVRSYLEKKRWTINQLSKEVGLSQPTVSRQISGSVALSADLLSGLLRVFPELSAEWLMRGNGEPEGVVVIQHPDELGDVKRRIDQLEQRISELEGEKKEPA